MAEQWLSIVEYARTYQVSDMTVRRRIKTGRLHAVLKDGKYFIPVAVGERSAPAGPMPGDGPISPARSPASQPAAPRRPQNDMTVVKARPHAAKPWPQPAHHNVGRAADTVPPYLGGSQSAQPMASEALARSATAYVPERRAEPEMVDYASDDGAPAPHNAGGGFIPSSLRGPLSAHETSLVDTRALIAFCEAAMRKANESERRTIERFKSKLEAVEATLAARDQEVKALKQQLEDLQLLVQILERK
jgi:hypothetical protein